MAVNHSHPHVPRDVNLSDFIPGVLSQSTILGVYGTASFFVFTLVWALSGSSSSPLTSPTSTLLSTCPLSIYSWIGHVRALFRGLDSLATRLGLSSRETNMKWAFTGLTHIILEGYFVFSPRFYKEKTGFFLAEVWKEYSKGDSRYIGRDAGVVAAEGITAVIEGPASLLAMYAIAKKSSYSHILQIAISLGQLYGTAVYFITAFLEGDNFAASVYYYYFYFVVMNPFWILIPTLIVTRSWKKICAAFQAQVPVQKQIETR